MSKIMMIALLAGYIYETMSAKHVKCGGYASNRFFDYTNHNADTKMSRYVESQIESPFFRDFVINAFMRMKNKEELLPILYKLNISISVSSNFQELEVGEDVISIHPIFFKTNGQEIIDEDYEDLSKYLHDCLADIFNNYQISCTTNLRS